MLGNVVGGITLMFLKKAKSVRIGSLDKSMNQLIKLQEQGRQSIFRIGGGGGAKERKIAIFSACLRAISQYLALRA